MHKCVIMTVLTTGQKLDNLPPGNKIAVFEVRH